ncbi:MAG: pantoate--beta-alanine ligase [Planctomycetota bacterium]
MNVFTDIDPCRHAVRAVQQAGGTVGLVPIMSTLHGGHPSLIRAITRYRRPVVAALHDAAALAAQPGPAPSGN